MYELGAHTVTWQDPYGQYGQGPQGNDPYNQQGWQHTQPGWQDPYAQQQGYGYYGPPVGPPARSNGAAVGALVANIVSALLCCGGIAWLPGIILASMAMSRNNTDPESAKQLTLWSWVCFALNLVLMVALFVILFAVGVVGNDSGTSTPTY
jgi:hypothetical protein